LRNACTWRHACTRSSTARRCWLAGPDVRAQRGMKRVLPKHRMLGGSALAAASCSGPAAGRLAGHSTQPKVLGDQRACLHAATLPGCMQVADFGLCLPLPDDRPSITSEQRGMLAYQPPELLESGAVSPAADCYAFGVLLWEMWTAQARRSRRAAPARSYTLRDAQAGCHAPPQTWVTTDRRGAAGPRACGQPKALVHVHAT